MLPDKPLVGDLFHSWEFKGVLSSYPSHMVSGFNKFMYSKDDVYTIQISLYNCLLGRDIDVKDKDGNTTVLREGTTLCSVKINCEFDYNLLWWDIQSVTILSPTHGGFECSYDPDNLTISWLRNEDDAICSQIKFQ